MYELIFVEFQNPYYITCNFENSRLLSSIFSDSNIAEHVGRVIFLKY